MKFRKFFRRKSRKEKPDTQVENTASPLVEEAKEEISNTGEPEKQTSSPLRIIYSGHRGSGANETQYELPEDERTPENSLASFKKAFKDGVECIEFDVYKSVDNQLMVTHSNDLAVYSLFKNPKHGDQPEEGQHLISKKTAEVVQNYFDISNISAKEYIDNSTYKYHDLDTGEHIYDKDKAVYERDYQKIPTLQNLFAEVSKENIKRHESGLPNVKLNMELKGIGTGQLVDSQLAMFNFMRSDEEKIDYKDIYFLSFNKQELLDVAKKQPEANLILGVPTIHTYMGADKTTYEITDHKLNTEELDKQVLGLDKTLQEIPGRNRGLDGVDMSLWDIGDEILDYYGGHKIPVNIAVTPYGKTNFEHEYLMPAIDNIQKIAHIQGSHFDEGEKPFVFVKTDTPSELQKIVEQSRQKEGKEQIVSAKEYLVDSYKKTTQQDRIALYKKPHHLYQEQLDSENSMDNRSI
ncbi:MAG: glycerophosphodiester phosphodiesterase family protein [Rickettsiales bacterium]|nr:glycerophosphodiester phosphodiesterase family protein [Pseudomonadota bacterium]MDA0967605.1 glycerophosphodiester phosphodiesterase family protein [Pseudomonadota bacterium]MDG4544365.1 glycerophosphodiester phosphodiesterase family protein [Rickettsiales bacterium]MDG4546495.1 glycerophosphodiester phosphodiesterase family protein [Rickettsiales bacterium]MDG4548669.1 glycerophosphodiester phosphodiesterase family protein [Rickettsiales bacterium]